MVLLLTVGNVSTDHINHQVYVQQETTILTKEMKWREIKQAYSFDFWCERAFTSAKNIAKVGKSKRITFHNVNVNVLKVTK